MSSSNAGLGPNPGDPGSVGQTGYTGQPAATQQPPAAGPGLDAAQYAHLKARRKSPALAGILSLMPGLGQVYVGHYQRGFINVVVVGSLIAFLSSMNQVASPSFEPLAGFFLSFFWMYNIIDAVRLAKFYNEALAGASSEDLRKGMILPTGGSLTGGIVLTVVGLLLILHTLFDMPLDWLEQWWPIVPIIFGVHLIYKGVKERKS